MIHHVSVGTNDPARARAFYQPLMDLLGLRLTFEKDGSFGFGTGETMFSVETPSDGGAATAGNGVHVAFIARDQEMVRRFYDLALENGGTCNGEPGLRPKYDANYFASFVLDPDGNKIEALTFSAV